MIELQKKTIDVVSLKRKSEEKNLFWFFVFLAVVVSLITFFSVNAFAEAFFRMDPSKLGGPKPEACRKDFSLKQCTADRSPYVCVNIKSNKEYFRWEEIETDKETMEFLQQINRRNTIVWKHHCIAVPPSWIAGVPFKNWDFKEMIGMPETNDNYKEKVIIVDLKNLAWGAYENSKLVKWGTANGGRGICKENGKLKCKTPIGEWKVISKSGKVTKSGLYPVECSDKKSCGHPMFWKMQFVSDGTSFHGDRNVPGANISHGCVRMFKRDAEWLNKQFVDIGTKIVILPY